MIPSSSDQSELRELLNALCDESITEDQMRRLEQLLLEQPEAEGYYVQYMSLHADLIGHFGALAPSRENLLLNRVTGAPSLCACPEAKNIKELPGNGAHRLTSRRTWKQISIGGLSIAGGILLLLFLMQHAPSRERVLPQLPTDSRAEVLDDSVAVLLQATNAQWETSDLATAVGSPLAPGWLRLKSGLAHIEFYSGANVILEGPAEFQIISRMKAYCARGRLRATVPPQAQGFEIGSPNMHLIDRGTEFGLMVTADGPTELHVFQGKVEYDKLNDAKAQGSYTALTTGHGVRLDDSGKISSIKLDSSSFHTVHDLRVSSEAEVRRKHEDWERFGGQLRQDKSLLVHFTFREEDAWSRTLINEMQSGEAHNGALVGSSWTTGRWAGKRGLEFTQVSDRVRFHVPGEFNSLTFMASVRVDALANQFNSLLMTDGWEEGEAHWHIGSNGTLELGIQGPKKLTNAHYEAPQAIGPQHLGRWIHLAVVYNGESGYVAHFLNGQSIAHVPTKFPTTLRIGEVEIGNWNIASHKNKSPVRNFNGCIDELIIFGRALDEPEVEQIYSVGRALE